MSGAEVVNMKRKSVDQLKPTRKPRERISCLDDEPRPDWSVRPALSF
jgi:hypothetical protein